MKYIAAQNNRERICFPPIFLHSPCLAITVFISYMICHICLIDSIFRFLFAMNENAGFAMHKIVMRNAIIYLTFAIALCGKFNILNTLQYWFIFANILNTS